MGPVLNADEQGENFSSTMMATSGDNWRRSDHPAGFTHLPDVDSACCLHHVPVSGHDCGPLADDLSTASRSAQRITAKARVTIWRAVGGSERFNHRSGIRQV
jgi:hypothetical protein